ncbi:hypothetical protein [Rufibacter soli]
MVIFVNMLVGKNIKASLVVSIKVLAGFLFFLFLAYSTSVQQQAGSLKLGQSKVHTAQKESIPLTFTASEPTESTGIIHESEHLLLPMLVLLLPLLFPVYVLLHKSRYLSSVYKIFRFYRILPNAP